MKIKKSEQTHIDNLGTKWESVLAAASLSIRKSPKLVGLDKIRCPMAVAAALNATGCPNHKGFVIPNEAGAPVYGIQEIVDGAFVAAVEAAKLKFAELV
jgi:hypothetical protein